MDIKWPRTGLGFDIHRLVEGRPLILAGVPLDFDKGPLGHSDGDVIFHALSDAILGALGLGDIGMHFSDKDPANKDIDSRLILEKCRDMARDNGFRVHQLDLNLIIEAPRIAPHRDSMLASIGRTLDLETGDMSLKARTHEGLGEIGRGEALACQAVVTLVPIA